MKHCDLCGTSMKDDEDFCPDCGVAYDTKTGNRLQVSDNGNCAAGKNTIDHIEQRVANYYNNTHLGSKPGKYVVLRHETTVSGNVCSIVVQYQDGKESDGNITYTPIADVAVNMITGDCSVHSRTVKRKANRTGTHYLCLFLLAGCILLWIGAPFAAINILTLGEQPTALQLMQGDVLYLGELSEAPQAWAALISIIGIVICAISTIAAANKVTRTVAILTELPMILVLIAMLDWADDAEELMEALGLGFWGISVLLLIVAIVIGINPIGSEKQGN